MTKALTSIGLADVAVTIVATEDIATLPVQVVIVSVEILSCEYVRHLRDMTAAWVCVHVRRRSTYGHDRRLVSCFRGQAVAEARWPCWQRGKGYLLGKWDVLHALGVKTEQSS